MAKSCINSDFVTFSGLYKFDNRLRLGKQIFVKNNILMHIMLVMKMSAKVGVKKT